MSYVTDNEAKELICEYGRRIYNRGFVDGNGGNITCKVGDNEAWVTPTMESKGFLNPDMLVKLDMDGNLLSKSEYKSSSEVKMHLGVMKANSDIQCVIHAHPTYATALAIVGEDIKSSLLPEGMGYFGDKVPIAPFAMPGTYEVPDSVIPFCKGRGHAALLANHGALTWGRTMKEAWFTMEVLENYCHIYILTNYVVGHYKEIPQEKADALRKRMGG
jgi:L-fuculose-phosphate aldolase